MGRRKIVKLATLDATGLQSRHISPYFLKRDRRLYGQRWQGETVFSMIKRNRTDCLNSKRYRSEAREVRLLAITHNLLIILLLVSKSFSTELKSTIGN